MGYSPCIICVQYHGGAQYRGGHHEYHRGDILSTVGMFSTVGDIMINVGDILSTVGDVQYCGGYHDKCWGYLEYCEDIMMHVGRYHEHCEGVQYHGRIPFFVIWALWGMSWVTWRCSVPWGTQITKDTVLMISPMVLHTPHGTAQTFNIQGVLRNGIVQVPQMSGYYYVIRMIAFGVG